MIVIFVSGGTYTRKQSIFFLALWMVLLFSAPAFAADSYKIIINKKVNKLAFIKNGLVVKIFPVATGRRPGYTPEGNFRVVRKLVKPAYRKLRIPGGSPRNPLGLRWLGFNARGTSGGTYGIHGTNNPRSIGKYASGGCIRMFNNDVIWLYDRVPVNTPVEIINRAWDLEQKSASVVVNGNAVKMPGFKAYVSQNRVIAPARLLAKSMGCGVVWPPKEKKVTFTYGNNAMSAFVGSSVIYVNGIMKRMGYIAVLKNNDIYLPVRFLAEAFGFQVRWDSKLRTVYLTKSNAAVIVHKQ